MTLYLTLNNHRDGRIESGDSLCLVTATYERAHDFCFGGALVWRKLIDERFDRTVLIPDW